MADSPTNLVRPAAKTKPNAVRGTDTLGEFARLRGYGVLLNTSFNTKGKPILSTIAEALEILKTTDVDYAVVEDYLFDARRVRVERAHAANNAERG